MWRDNVNQIRKEKGFSTQMISERTPSHIAAETISRVLKPNNGTDSPRIDTITEICTALGVEVWEIFYTGDKSFAASQAEITILKNERDALVAENAVLRDKVAAMRNKIDELKDDLITLQKYCIKQNSNK